MAKNRIKDTSLKALKSIFIIFSLILFITACDLQQQEEKKQESDLCTIKLSLSSASDSEPSSRVTIPEINLSDLYYSFKCMNSTTSDLVFQTPSDGANGKTKEEIESLQIKIPSGSYIFGLSAYTDPSCSNESLVLEFTSEPLFINPTLGTFTLNCQLSELAIATGIGTGTIDIRLEIPPLADVKNVKLDLIKINGDGTTNYIMTDQDFVESWEDGKQIMSFSKGDCERGDYLAMIRAQDSNLNLSPAVGELFHVAKGLTSRSNNTIEITYNLKYERYVSSEGDDDNGNGSFRAPFKTIERAVESINSFNETSQQWSIILASDLTLTEAAVIEGTVNAKSLILTSHVPESESPKSLIGNGNDTVLYYSSSIPLEIKNIQIRGGRVPSTSGEGKKNDNGGGLYIGDDSTSCYVSLSDNAVICDNEAVQGGGLYISGNSYLYVSGSAVIGRDSTTCSTVSSYSNLAKGSSTNGGGGGIYCAANGHLYLGYYKEGTFSPYEREFTGSISYNTTTSSIYSGGGIFVAPNGYLNISSGTIKYNYAKAQGGGICVRSCKSDTSLKISNLTLLSNEANTGGGIGVNNTNFTFENCTFESNYAGDKGGACYFDITGLNGFHDCQIVGNSAGVRGGGIYLYSVDSGATPRICLYGNTQIGINDAWNGDSPTAGGGVYLAKGILAVGAKSVTVSGDIVNPTLEDDFTSIVFFESPMSCLDGGGAIYCSKGTKLYLGPTAKFKLWESTNVTDAINDIYMDENSLLYVNNQFNATTEQQQFIAYIQPAENFYEDNTLQLLYLASNSSITIADVKNRFKIHPRSSTETNWSLNDYGCCFEGF